jgi:hypothetical protein
MVLHNNQTGSDAMATFTFTHPFQRVLADHLGAELTVDGQVFMLVGFRGSWAVFESEDEGLSFLKLDDAYRRLVASRPTESVADICKRNPVMAQARAAKRDDWAKE